MSPKVPYVQGRLMPGARRALSTLASFSLLSGCQSSRGPAASPDGSIHLLPLPLPVSPVSSLVSLVAYLLSP